LKSFVRTVKERGGIKKKSIFLGKVIENEEEISQHMDYIALVFEMNNRPHLSTSAIPQDAYCVEFLSY
jgi:hypothetical protein